MEQVIKNYEAPKVDILEVHSENIICGSQDGFGGQRNNYEQEDWE